MMGRFFVRFICESYGTSRNWTGGNKGISISLSISQDRRDEPTAPQGKSVQKHEACLTMETSRVASHKSSLWD